MSCLYIVELKRNTQTFPIYGNPSKHIKRTKEISTWNAMFESCNYSTIISGGTTRVPKSGPGVPPRRPQNFRRGAHCRTVIKGAITGVKGPRISGKDPRPGEKGPGWESKVPFMGSCTMARRF